MILRNFSGLKRGGGRRRVRAQEVRQLANAREVSDRYTDLINAHDAAAIGDLYADDGVLRSHWRISGTRGSSRVLDGVR
jgi:ketosteroid isomerase-like protein